MDAITREALVKVISKINENKSLLHYPKSSGYSNEDVTGENLADLACNHLFNDHYDLFDITEYQGHVIRGYIHNVMLNDPNFDELNLLISEVLFSDNQRVTRNFENLLTFLIVCVTLTQLI